MKVLIAEDEPVSRRLLQLSLSRWGYDTVVAGDGLEAERILLGPDAPEMAVLDWMMPGVDGARLCEAIRRIKPEPYTYVILLTAKRGQEDVVAGLEAGADDYVRKPFDPQELKVRLRTGKRILYLQDHLISAREALRDRAMRDQLTGLWNRAAILDVLERELDRAKREDTPLAVALADLDFFKQINDTYGHACGDEVLRRTAQTMRATARRYDFIGRYGGEEFLIVLPNCDPTNALTHAERLRAAVGAASFETPSAAIQLTASVGVAVFQGDNNCDAFSLIEAADVALYQAKRAGRNRVKLGLDDRPCVAIGR